MGWLTKYGTTWGKLPRVTGNVYFVAPSASYTIEGRANTASDDNDGLSPERALLTLQRAINLATASVGDAIILLNGTHTVTATVAVNKAGITIWGVTSDLQHWNPLSPATILTSTGTNDELLNITVAGVELGYMVVRPTTGYGAVTFQTTAAIAGFYAHHIHGDLYTPAVNRDTHIFDFSNRAGGTGLAKVAATTNAISHVVIEDFTVEANGAQGSGIEAATMFGIVRRGQFFNTAGIWATPFRVATGVDNLLIDDCVWTTTATMGACVEGGDASAGDGVTIRRCGFPPTTALTTTLPVENFASTRAVLTDSWQAGNATQMTSIT